MKDLPHVVSFDTRSVATDQCCALNLCSSYFSSRDD